MLTYAIRNETVLVAYEMAAKRSGEGFPSGVAYTFHSASSGPLPDRKTQTEL